MDDVKVQLDGETPEKEWLLKFDCLLLNTKSLIDLGRRMKRVTATSSSTNVALYLTETWLKQKHQRHRTVSKRL